MNKGGAYADHVTSPLATPSVLTAFIYTIKQNARVGSLL